MVSVINRPVGHKFGTGLIDASVSNSSGIALFTTVTPHGMTTGNYVYIDSDFDSYNGVKYVHVISLTSFKVSDSENGTLSPFKQNAIAGFYISELEHGWSCVHLPIVYELHSNLFPNNELDESYSPRTIGSFSNSNGYTVLNLSLDLYNYRNLDFIVLIGDGPLSGPYQIVNAIDANSPIINLAYSASNDFSVYRVEQYYNNYFIGVNIYAGLDVDHDWQAEKPFKLIATLKLVPDSNGDVKFSIAEILKSQITTRNNLSLDTLPNNLDFFTEFYISYFEGYDVSDNVTITKFQSASTIDSFIGQAVNAITAFKSLNSGYLSDYINSDETTGQWLTIQERPAAIVGYYFDLSFINTVNMVDVLVTIYKKYQGYVYQTDIITLHSPGKGVLRLPIVAENGFDEYCISAKTPESTVTIIIPPANFDLSTFGQVGNFSRGLWMISSTPVYNRTGYNSSYTLFTNYITLNGIGYVFSFDITIFVCPPGTAIDFFLYDLSLGSGLIIHTEPFSAPGNYTGSFTINSLGRDGFGLYAYATNPADNINLRINSITHGTSTTETITISGVDLTEQICIDIVDECDTYTEGNARLTENGNIRILE